MSLVGASLVIDGFIPRVLLFQLFFFQAEDGIRDADVTEVQTCALPICASWQRSTRSGSRRSRRWRCWRGWWRRRGGRVELVRRAGGLQRRRTYAARECATDGNP